ncbi:uncharacterized protein EI90DRAFT_3180855 [Cantharellus anzutake]|uniref:uncharacterized protein n=1 Tax=Cantharellus anzutake TaxID=1750568 RepID=UPI00190699F3|nr:uncharacterized protein EI90DRAFT_3180855 [Cantharellus anzutake]KAF8334188.1 hypothetical protein EI90DRAFT_3180855 [Cantharellus anzutake]
MKVERDWIEKRTRDPQCWGRMFCCCVPMVKSMVECAVLAGGPLVEGVVERNESVGVTAGLEPAFLAVNFLSAYGAIVGATTIAPRHEEVVERKMNRKGVGWRREKEGRVGVTVGLEPTVLWPVPSGLTEVTIGVATIALVIPKSQCGSGLTGLRLIGITTVATSSSLQMLEA